MCINFSYQSLRLISAAFLFTLTLFACGNPSPSPAPVETLPSLSETSSPTILPSPIPAATLTLTATTASPEHRLGVRVVNEVGEFYDRTTNERFVPRGNNYTRLVANTLPCLDRGSPYHAVFNVGVYDASRTDKTLAAMQQNGYNVVRVFLNGSCLGKKEGGLNQDYVNNIADFLRLAKAHGLFVILTTDDPPVPGYSGEMKHYDDIDWENRQFLTVDGMQANGRFWEDLITSLVKVEAPLDAIFAYELRNEQFFMADRRPLNMTSGLVMTGNGNTYDMADPNSRLKMISENIVYWIDGVRAMILEVDPTTLVTVGFFLPQGPNPARIGDVRWVTTAPAIWESGADFIDLHAYPGSELNLEQYVENFGMAGMQQKPIIMGEFGAARSAFPSTAVAAKALHDWQVESCQYGFDGWLLWTWDTDEQADFYFGLGDGGLINQALSPVSRPDPCQPGSFAFFENNLALGKQVRASSSLPDQPPSGVVDGMSDKWWGAGAHPPQWIEIDLGEPKAIRLIRLIISQSPAGETVHQIWGGKTHDQLQLLHEFKGNTVDNQVLEFNPSSPLLDIRYIRVVTIQSPSWVAWKEIELLSP